MRTVIDELIALGLGIRPLLLTNACDAAVGVAAIRAGARGYLTRAQLALDARLVLHAVTADQIICSHATESAILEQLFRSALLAARHPPIHSSPIEHEPERALGDVR